MNMQALISDQNLTALAGRDIFRRGAAYFAERRVTGLRDAMDGVSAYVEGTRRYRVTLAIRNGELSNDCNCPHARDGYFCKHCVAVSLAWRNMATDLPSDPWRDIASYLAAQEQAELVALLMEVARDDEHLYRALLGKARRAAPGFDPAAHFSELIEQNIPQPGEVAWDEVVDVAEGLHELVDELEPLAQPATSAVLMDLLEPAILRVEHMITEVDDSDGDLGDVVYRLAELYGKAVRLARPAPLALAQRLLALHTALPVGICAFDDVQYADALGPEGRQHFHDLVRAEWRRVQETGEEPPYFLQGVLERIARDSGDIEQLVAFKARNLTAAYQYLDIATLYAQAGNEAQALDWAERGMQAYAHQNNYQLRGFLAARYASAGRHEDAVRLIWAHFVQAPGFNDYVELAGHARQAGTWEALRGQALDQIDLAQKPLRHGHQRDCSLRVAIALWENDLEMAWEQAHGGRCELPLLTELADKLVESDIDGAAALYRRVVAASIEHANNRAYEQAMEQLRVLAAAWTRHQRHAELASYIGHLRQEFKRKRNFIKLLDAWLAEGHGG